MILGKAHTILNTYNCHPGKCGSIYPGSFVYVERKIPGQARDDRRKKGKTTSLLRRLFLLTMTLILLHAGTAYAACSNPSGVEGEQVYNSTHKVMQYCDGTHWTAMRATGKADQSALDALTTTVGQKANQSALNSLTSTVNGKVSKSGDTMTGALNLSGAPIANNQAATKEYVDTVAASSGGGTYQISCAFSSIADPGAASYMYCVRMNVSTGATECKNQTWSGGWQNCSAGSPW